MGWLIWINTDFISFVYTQYLIDVKMLKLSFVWNKHTFLQLSVLITALPHYLSMYDKTSY